MTQPGRAGRASIEIVGDVSKLGRQLERDAQRAVSDIDLDTNNIVDQISDAFSEGASEGIDALEETLPDAQKHFGAVAKLAEEAANSMALDFEEGGVRIRNTFADGRKDSKHFFDGIGEDAKDAGEDVRTNLLRPLTSGFSRLGEVISSAGSALAGIGLTGTNPLGLATLALEALALAAVIPVVIGLAAALADLVGFAALLPAAIGGAASAAIVLTVAFKGFGDAISAVLEGDPEKIAEAMERLAPAARLVVKEFERVLPIFKSVGQEIQQGFFIQLTGVLERFGAITLPRVRDELRGLSEALGSATAGLGGLLSESKNIPILERLFASTGRIVDNLGEAFLNLGQSLLEALDAGLPSLETLTGRLSEAINTFANFLSESIADESFQAFLDDAVKTLDELLALGGAVGDLLAVLFGGTDEAGRGFIATLTDVTKRLTEFFNSVEGQDVLGDFNETIVFVGQVLGVTINILREAISFLGALDDAANAAIEAIFDFGEAVTQVWNTAAAAVSSAIDAIGQFFVELGSDIADLWSGAVEAVSTGVDNVVAFFAALPGRVGDFLESIPDRVAAIFNEMSTKVIQILGFLIAAVVVFFTDMPEQIAGALTALVDRVRETFTSAETSVTDTFDRIGVFISSIPALLAAAWGLVTQQVVGVFTGIHEFVVSTWESIVAFFTELPGRIGAIFQQVTDAVVARVTAMVDYVKGLPGQILAAIGNLGTLLYDAGANVIQGLINGIKSKIGQLRDSIASSVQEIRDHLPFSPAKKGPLSGSGSPERAGAVIGSMIASGLDSQLAQITDAAGRAAAAAGISLSPLGEAGVTPLTTPIPSQRGTVLTPTSERADQQLVLLVTIGGEEVYAVIDKRVETAVSTEVRRLVAGARGI